MDLVECPEAYLASGLAQCLGGFLGVNGLQRVPASQTSFYRCLPPWCHGHADRLDQDPIDHSSHWVILESLKPHEKPDLHRHAAGALLARLL